MNVLCLGAGAMGRLAAQTVAGFSEVAGLTIADLDEGAAGAAAGQCGPKARACGVSVLDRDRLKAVMKDHDAVLNCVGPFFRFAVPILTCSIEAGVHYFDICDDPEPTRDMLDMSDEARAAGITAVIGLGATPGITNMLAAKVHAKMTTTRELHVAWNIEEKTSDSPEGLEYSAAIVHWMKQCSGTILEQRGGILVQAKPLRDVSLHYPGRGSRKVWTVGHPEPVSFSRSFPEIEESSCYMVMPGLAADFFRDLSDRIDKGLSLEEAGQELVAWTKEDSIIDRGIAALYRLFEGPRLPVLFVLGKGQVDGRDTTVAASLRSMPPGMARMTGIPLAIALHQFAQNGIKERGVLTPETSLDAERFFEELAPYCSYPQGVRMEDLVEMAVE